MYDKNIGEMTVADLDAFIEGRASEAGKLASALEDGTILTTADIKKARARLTEINDELSRAGDRRRWLELFEVRMSKQWEEVESLAREWLEQQPNDVYLIQAIGEALEKQGHIEQALEYYEKALAVDRQEQHEFGLGHTFFLKRLDILYHRLGRYDDCLRVCQYYTSRHDGSYDAWNRLRRAAQKTGNTELSKIAGLRADEVKPERLKKPKKRKKVGQVKKAISGGPAIDILDEAIITEGDIERARKRFKEYAKKYDPELENLLDAEIDEGNDKDPD